MDVAVETGEIEPRDFGVFAGDLGQRHVADRDRAKPGELQQFGAAHAVLVVGRYLGGDPPARALGELLGPERFLEFLELIGLTEPSHNL